MRTTDPLNIHTSDVDHRSRIGVPNLRPLKFKLTKPLELRDNVAVRKTKSNDKACMAEMMQLFTCFSKKDFETSGCPKEVAELNACWKRYLDTNSEAKKRGAQELPTQNQSIRDMTSLQVNALFKRYPIQHLLKSVRK